VGLSGEPTACHADRKAKFGSLSGSIEALLGRAVVRHHFDKAIARHVRYDNEDKLERGVWAECTGTRRLSPDRTRFHPVSKLFLTKLKPRSGESMATVSGVWSCSDPRPGADRFPVPTSIWFSCSRRVTELGRGDTAPRSSRSSPSDTTRSFPWCRWGLRSFVRPRHPFFSTYGGRGYVCEFPRGHGPSREG